jgi:hypothetical protein
MAAAFDGDDLGVTLAAPAEPVARTALGRMAGFLENVVLLVLVVLLFPVAILVIGTPIVLCVRALVAIAQRL